MNHLTSVQRYHLFVEYQNRQTRKEKTLKEIAAEIGKHPSTICREYKRNATLRGGYNDTKAQAMADARRSQGAPHNKTPRLLLWRIEQWIIEEQWSPAQIVGKLAQEGIRISKQTIDNHIFAAHQDITKGLNGVIVYFADSYCSWQKGLVENTNKLIRQYIPKGSDFSSITPRFIKKVQAKLNRRPREKLNFSTPTIEFFKHFS